MKNILYYIFGLLIISSCSPNQDENGDFLRGVEYDTQIGGDGGSTTSKQLKQLTTHFKDDTGAWDDNVITYSYTGNKLTSYKDNSGATTNLTYGSNNKISKLSNPGETSTFEYSGNNLFKIVTNITGVTKITSTFSYTGGKLSKVIAIQEITIPFPVKTYLETSYEYQGENMTKSIVKSGAYDDTGALIMNPDPITITATYDTKKSPYKLLPTEYITYLSGIGSRGGINLSSNNFLKITITEPGSATETQNFTHTYDGDYPTKSTAGDEYILYQYN